MSEQSTDDPFEDCELGPEAILGTQTFEDVLFTEETETLVNVLTGETPEHSQATVDEARAFALSIDTKTPQIALSASVETQIETASKPYTAAAFFHFKATGSLQRHRAYHAADESIEHRLSGGECVVFRRCLYQTVNDYVHRLSPRAADVP